MQSYSHNQREGLITSPFFTDARNVGVHDYYHRVCDVEVAMCIAQESGSVCSTYLSHVEPTTWNQDFPIHSRTLPSTYCNMVPRFHNRRVVRVAIDRGPLLLVIFSLNKITWNQWNQDKCPRTTRSLMQFLPVPRKPHLHGTTWNPWNHILRLLWSLNTSLVS